MADYSVLVLYDASRLLEVSADSPGEASSIAQDDAGQMRLCFHCARDVDAGGPIGAHVYSGNDLILDDTSEGRAIRACNERGARIAELEAEVARLRACNDASLAAMRRAVLAMAHAAEEAPGLYGEAYVILDEAIEAAREG